jgi:23S rRNA pseudouridine955/2504/2580 synthase
MTDPTPQAPPTTGARTVRVAEDRDGQRIDNFLLGYLKGSAAQPGLQAVALRPGAGERRADQGRAAPGSG